MKRLLRFILAFIIAVPLGITGQSTRAEAADDSSLAAQLIYYYREGNTFDQQRILQKMQETSPAEYNNWTNILNEWRYIDNEMPLPTSAPDGITDSSTHAFVLLGGGLYSDGRLGESGIGRCEAAYQCAVKYPDSKIVITGGQTLTALKKQNKSEARVMADYLINIKHLDAGRIILEEKATSTVTNARNTMKLLYEQTNITSITIVSSDYHCRRGTLLFYTQSLLDSQAYGKNMIRVDGCVAFPDISSRETIRSEASSEASLMNVKIPSSLPTSVLTSLQLITDSIVPLGTVPSVRINAIYSVDNYTIDVTDQAIITNISASTLGKQTIDATYSDGSRTVTGSVEVQVVDPSIMAYVMYRVYNPNSGEHFFTNSVAEKDNLVSVGWSYEGTAWVMPQHQDIPVYRLYNPVGGEHHYTTSTDEKNMLISKGWNDEGIGWYSEQSTGTPVYRVYNPNAFANNHHYTTSKTEADYLVSLGWRYEGIGWYGYVLS